MAGALGSMKLAGKFSGFHVYTPTTILPEFPHFVTTIQTIRTLRHLSYHSGIPPGLASQNRMAEPPQPYSPALLFFQDAETVASMLAGSFRTCYLLDCQSRDTQPLVRGRTTLLVQSIPISASERTSQNISPNRRDDARVVKICNRQRFFWSLYLTSESCDSLRVFVKHGALVFGVWHQKSC